MPERATQGRQHHDPERPAAPEHQHPDREHRPARHRLALPRRGAGRGVQPLPRTDPRRGRRTTAVPLAGQSPAGSPSRSPPTLDDDDPPRPARRPRPLGPGRRPAGHLPLRHRRRDGDLRPRLRHAPVPASGCSPPSPNILDDDLSISSAGLLRGGAVAWVEVSVPETDHHPGGRRRSGPTCWPPPASTGPSPPPSSAPSPTRSATTPASSPWPSRAGLQGQALPLLPRQARRRPGGPGDGAHPRRRLRRRGRRALRHHRQHRAVGAVPRRPRAAVDDQHGHAARGPSR